MPSWLPFAAVSTFLGLGLLFRAVLQKVRHGTFGVVLFAGDARQKVRDGGILLLFASLLAQAIVVWAVGQDAVPLRIDAIAPRPWTGGALAFCGIAMLVGSQLQLGRSWRIGIDEHARPGLVTAGVYRVCRNPIFLGLWVMLLGNLLLVPTWVSLLQFTLTVVGVSLQVRDEERWLLSAYGDDYRAYAARVGRFVPGIGRLQSGTR